MKPYSRHPPPLKTQLAAITIVGLIFGTGALLYLNYEARIERVFDDRDRQLLAELAVDDRRIRIVGIGTSLLRQATLRGDQISVLGEEIDHFVHYARLCRPAGRTPGRPDLMAEVADANPDVVIFEKTYLLNRPRKAWLGRRYLNLSRALVRQVLSPRESVQMPPDPQTFFRRWNRDRQHQRNDDEDRLEYHKQIWSDYMVFGLRPGSRSLFRDLVNSGTKIYVVELPPHQRVLSIHSDDELAEIEASLDSLVEEGLVALMECPLNFNERHFLDPVHLNPEGQRRFSRWLFGEMVKLAAPNPIENDL